MKFTVTESVEIILDGKKYLLEAGDNISMNDDMTIDFSRHHDDRVEMIFNGINEASISIGNDNAKAAMGYLKKVYRTHNEMDTELSPEHAEEFNHKVKSVYNHIKMYGIKNKKDTLLKYMSRILDLWLNTYNKNPGYDVDLSDLEI